MADLVDFLTSGNSKNVTITRLSKQEDLQICSKSIVHVHFVEEQKFVDVISALMTGLYVYPSKCYWICYRSIVLISHFNVQQITPLTPSGHVICPVLLRGYAQT